MARPSGDQLGNTFSCAVDGDAALVGAVVVGDEDLLDVALLRRCSSARSRDAVRRERELGAGHAAQLALRLVDLVGHGVGVEPRVAGRAAVLAAQHLLPACARRTAASRRGSWRRSASGAEHQARRRRARASDRTARRRTTAPAESTRRCRAEPSRTRARTTGRRRAPGRAACAISAVSASPPGAMKSGTAICGVSPGSPVMLTPTVAGLLRAAAAGRGACADVATTTMAREPAARQASSARHGRHRWYSNVRWTVSDGLGTRPAAAAAAAPAARRGWR